MKWSGKDAQAEVFPNAISGQMLLQYFLPLLCRSGISSPKTATEKFFGCDGSLLASTVYFPRKLERLDYWVSPDSGITGKKLICDHTAYSYHSISHIKDVYQQMENVIRDGIPERGIASLVHKMISKSKYVFAGQYLRYCPECAKEDIRKYGEAYWHRLPQLPGVRFCPKHGCHIKNSSAPFDEMWVRIYPASYVLRNMDDDAEGQSLLYKEEYLSIAKETEWLLENGR